MQSFKNSFEIYFYYRRQAPAFECGEFNKTITRVYSVNPDGSFSLLGESQHRNQRVDIPDHIDRILVECEKEEGKTLFYYAG